MARSIANIPKMLSAAFCVFGRKGLSVSTAGHAREPACSVVTGQQRALGVRGSLNALAFLVLSIRKSSSPLPVRSGWK